MDVNRYLDLRRDWAMRRIEVRLAFARLRTAIRCIGARARLRQLLRGGVDIPREGQEG